MTTEIAELPRLNISCTASDCEQQLHCYRKTRNMSPEQVGQCRSCGVQLVDWERVQRRDLADAPFTFSVLKTELIRHHFFHVAFDETAELHARRKGRAAFPAAVTKRLRSSIAREQPARDGQQTPYEGNVIFYAQHALACCCRTCLESWHGIPKGRALTEEELTYLTELVVLYIAERMPNLPDQGEKIPPRRSKKAAEGV